MIELLPTLTNLGGTVVTVVLFLWYLTKKDAQTNKALSENTRALSELNTNLALQGEVLKNVCKASD